MVPNTSGEGAVSVGVEIRDTVGLGFIVGVAFGVMMNLGFRVGRGG